MLRRGGLQTSSSESDCSETTNNGTQKGDEMSETQRKHTEFDEGLGRRTTGPSTAKP